MLASTENHEITKKPLVKKPSYKIKRKLTAALTAQQKKILKNKKTYKQVLAQIKLEKRSRGTMQNEVLGGPTHEPAQQHR